MGYGVSQIVETISGSTTATPLLETGGSYSGTTYKDPDLAKWYWAFASVDPDLAMTAPTTVSGFKYKAYTPNVSIGGGISTDTPILTFTEAKPRMLSFRTRISGEFTLSFKIMAGGDAGDEGDGIQSEKILRSDDAGIHFGNSSRVWDAPGARDNPVFIAYNTSSHARTGGTWVVLNTYRAYGVISKRDFNNSGFTTISVTHTLPADAYVAFIQGNIGSSTHSGDAQFENWALADVQLTYIDPSVIAGYESVTVSTFSSHWNEMQRVLNGGISSSDISTTPWVETYHLKPMRFYGSPAPRVESVSGDVHYRFERTMSMLYDGQGEDFMPIHGLATTIHVAPPFNDTPVTGLVRCNFFAEESDGSPVHNPEGRDICDFGLMVLQGNGTPQFISGSLRSLFQEKDGTYVGKKNISIINRVNLSVGINHVYIGIRFSEGTSGRGRVNIARKVFVVDVKYI